MNKLYIILLLNTLFISTSFNHKCVGQRFCGQYEKEIDLFSKDKELLKMSIGIEKSYAAQIKNPKYASRNGVISLPVVIHIIHNNGIENISDSRVFQAIENLNDAFRNRNYYNPETGTDTKIEFCLAKRDTANNEISGIIRHQSGLTDMSTHYSNTLISEISAFNPDEYINIRIVKNLCIGTECSDYAGYAVNGLTGSQNFRNGIVIQYNYFGVSPRSDVVVTHEMGHFLGLKHTFQGGCKNDDCLKDGDRVCDTPPDNSTVKINCTISSNSCYTDEDDASSNNPFRATTLGGVGDQNDMHQNYMDYGFFRCKNQFTEGQSDRMHWFVNNIFPSLLDSKACLPPCVNEVEANFIATPVSYQSLNLGENVLFTGTPVNSDSSYWVVNCVDTFYNSSFLFEPNESGIYNIKYIAIASDEECNNDISYFSIDVTCPVLPDFFFTINGNEISFTNTSTNIDSFYWEIYDGPNIIHTSLLDTETVEIASSGLFNICLTVTNNLCQEIYCQFFDIYGNGVEICDNELDDDNDGLVDLFDPDCICEQDSYHGQCLVDCQYLPDSFPQIEPKLKWVSEVLTTNLFALPNFLVGDFTQGNNNNEIITLSDKRNFFTNTGEIHLVAINGDNGQIIQDKLFDRLLPLQLVSDGAIGDVNRDGLPEFFMHTGDSLYIFNSDFSIQENKDISIINTFSGNSINLADFNGDGLAEVYINSSIFNSRGDLIIKNELGGCNFIGINGCLTSHTIAADLLPSPGLELAAGNIVYDIEINNINDTTGNIATKIYADDKVGDGFTSVGDIDGDGALDVIVVRGSKNDKNGVWVWNPRTGQIIAKGTVGEEGGGVAFIGDIDGDCQPEIGVAFERELRMYKYDGTLGLKDLYSVVTYDPTARTTLSMFDFNQDGRTELLYRDGTTFRIIDGTSGTILFSYPVFSFTGIEYPVVADIDNDGEAEILVSGGINSKDSMRIFCFESNSSSWAPARAVWNQYGYHVTNVNDDLTIPRNPQNGAIDLIGNENCLRENCPTPYNNFFTQATYRTQEGCFNWPAIDLVIDVLDYECYPDSNCFTISVTNIGPKKITKDSVSIYWGYKTGNPNDNYSISQAIVYFQKDSDGNIFNNSDSITVCTSRNLNVPIGSDSTYMLFGVNDGGLGPNISFDMGRQIYECDYLNNYDSVEINQKLPMIDLGLDIVKCGGEVITFELSGYDSYVWNDLSTDSIYSTSFEGLHYVEALDVCGASYHDTIQITFDTLNEINLGTNISFCPNESLEISVDGVFDSLQWFPKNVVNCDDCSTIEILSDTSLYIFVVAKKGSCISTDSIFVAIIEEVLIYDTVTICAQEQYIYQDSILTTSGTYEFNINNCDSVVMITVIETPSDSVPFSQSICSGDSVLFDNQWIYESGTYINSTLNGEGCDSTNILELEIYSEILSTDTIEICKGDTIQIFNTNVYSDSIITETFVSGSGCDSLYTVYVLENDILSKNIYERICLGDSILIEGNWYEEEGDFSYMISNPEGCDSLINIEITVKDVFSAFDTIQTCEGDTLSIFGFLIFETSDIEQTHVTEEECDSTIFVHVEVINSLDTSIANQICQGDSIVIGEQVMKETGDYDITLMANNGCDSIIHLNLMVFDIENVVEDILICKGDSIQINGQFYSQPETLSFSVLTNDGCDSLTTINIDTVESFIDTTLVFLCEGDSILIDSIYIKEGGEYLIENVSTFGCDSTIYYNIELIQGDVGFAEFTICEFDSIQVEGVWLFDQGLNEVHTLSFLGCDSTINVRINHILPKFSTIDTSFCSGDSILIDNEWFAEDTNIEIHFESSEGCDSLITFQILEVFPEINEDTTFVCAGDSIFHNEVWIKENQSFNDTVYTGNCFDIFHDYFIFTETFFTEVTKEICAGDSILIDTVYINEAGEYLFKYTSHSGCDSIVNYVVSLIQPENGNTEYIICEGDSIQVEGVWLFDAGVNEVNTTTSLGCDSTIQVLIHHILPKHNTIDTLFCEGDSIFIDNQWINETTSIDIKQVSSEGCDSIVTIQILEVFPEIYKDTTTLCAGDSILHNGVWVKENETFLDTVYTGDCFGIFHDYFIFIESITTEISNEICVGDTLFIYGLSIVEGGTYEALLTSMTNCDSLILISVTKIIEPLFPDLYFDCEANVQVVELTEEKNWKNYWSNGDSSLTTIYSSSADESVLLKHINGCEVEYSFRVDIPANIEFEIFLNDTTINKGEIINYNIAVDSFGWKIEWFPSAIVTCDTCFSTNLSASETTEVSVHLMNEFGCSFETDFTVNVKEKLALNIPNIFSPNNDNLNDNWIVNLSEYPINDVKIYDRWGNLMGHWINQDELVWDGKFNMQDLSNGVYIYCINYSKVQNKIEQKIGDVTILR